MKKTPIIVGAALLVVVGIALALWTTRGTSTVKFDTPYQAVLLAILLANVYFVYRFARALGASQLAAALAALAACYHGGIANLYYNAAFVYDAMCCCLYLAALVFYVSIRNRGGLLGIGQTVVFLALLLAALNAKETAGTALGTSRSTSLMTYCPATVKAPMAKPGCAANSEREHPSAGCPSAMRISC